MMRALLLGLVVLAACTTMQPPSEPADAPPPTQQHGGDTCNLARYQSLVGMDESAIDQSTLPAHHRTICFGCMATMEYVADRLTIQIGPGHKVASVRCG